MKAGMNRRKQKKSRKKRIFRIRNPAYVKAALVMVFALCCFAAIYKADTERTPDTDPEGRGRLKRNGHGEGTEDVSMQVRIGDLEEEIQISVSEQGYTSEELDQLFSDISGRLGDMILGENASLDQVRSDLELITSVPDTGVSISWELDNYRVMDIEGNLREENLTEEGTLVQLNALMKYGEDMAVHTLYANVFPPETGEEERIIQELQAQIAESDEATRAEEYLILPGEAQGEKIYWTYGESTRAYGILILGVGATCMIFVSEKQKKKEEAKKRTDRMKTDYPGIINKLTLYIGAGMTVRKAWFLIASDYQRRQMEDEKKLPREAYEEMIYTMNQISGGGSEGECYEEYGARCGIPMYRKFGTMLSQNMRKGTKGLTDLLRKEAEDAFEERMNLARKKGEEAGTKLMIPMFAMLAIVFAVVIIPALFTVQI